MANKTNNPSKTAATTAEKVAAKIATMSRGQVEVALTSGTVDPAVVKDHQNQHVRRSAWRLLGAEIPEDDNARKSLADKLYPNHVKRLEAVKEGDKRPRLPTVLKKILNLN